MLPPSLPDHATQGTAFATLQPDQDPARWDGHAEAYEAVFEGLTNAFAARALDLLEPLAGARLLDLGAGAGGAALQAAARGAQVTAFDASAAMVTRIRARSGNALIRAEEADARLPLPRMDGCFDAALSCLGLVLLPEPVPALREIRRVLRRDGMLAVVTWSEPERYELAARLWDAIAQIRGAASPAGPAPPAQLRYADPAALAALVEAGGFALERIERVEASLHAASARALAAGLDFAPGMAALLGSLGADWPAVQAAFAAGLEADQGRGPVALGAVARIAVGRRV
ncbi:MAG TPA: methyltransferase domain-containing protein [Falsiroseomonas sp.]|nr:methyltransferase domain-containing protein [Falsiroseomonas sp.]